MYMAKVKILQPLYHWLAFGFCVGGNANLYFALGVTQILAFLNANILVSPTQNCGVGGLSQCQDPMQMALPHSGIWALHFNTWRYCSGKE